MTCSVGVDVVITAAAATATAAAAAAVVADAVVVTSFFAVWHQLAKRLTDFVHRLAAAEKVLLVRIG